MFLTRANFLGVVSLLLSAFMGTTAIGTQSAAKSGEASTLTDPAGADADWSELSAGMEAMHRSMAAVRASKDSDLNFVSLMQPHHQAAIDMAKAELKYGNDPQMRRLAQEILTDQQSEIELMRLWLKQRDSVPKAGRK